MKESIINRIKYNRRIYSIYFHLAGTIINIFKLFVSTDDKLILFNSFAGRKYDDSPKEIFELMKTDARFSDYHLVWAFHKPEKYSVEGADVIKTDGFQYFKTAIKAKVWVSNSSVERGLKFKKKNTFFLNTWHGTPIKLMGSDLDRSNQSFGAKGKSSVNIMMSQGNYETAIFSRTFGIPKENFLEVGLPRNDILAHYSEEYREELRQSLGIPKEKKVILYCPTFREFDKDQNQQIILAPPIEIDKWRKSLGDKFILMFRAHYEVSKAMKIIDDDFIRDVTDYPTLNDLFIASDLLVSDYSSVFFDYSITGKPMFHFTYDYDRYNSNRGMYFDIREYLNGGASEDTVIGILKDFEEKVEKARARAFGGAFVNYYGNATKAAVDCIWERVRGEQ